MRSTYFRLDNVILRQVWNRPEHVFSDDPWFCHGNSTLFCGFINFNSFLVHIYFLPWLFSDVICAVSEDLDLFQYVGFVILRKTYVSWHRSCFDGIEFRQRWGCAGVFWMEDTHLRAIKAFQVWIEVPQLVSPLHPFNLNQRKALR